MPDLPTSLERLPELARNLWWAWYPEAWVLFEELQDSVQEPLHHIPVQLLTSGSTVCPAPSSAGLPHPHPSRTTRGLLFVNRSAWAHCVEQVAKLLGIARDSLLEREELAALDRQAAPEGRIV